MVNRLGWMLVLFDHSEIRRANLAKKVPGAVRADFWKSICGGPKYGRSGDVDRL